MDGVEAGGWVGGRIAALACLEVLPDEPTLAQAGVVRPQVAAVLALAVGPDLAAGIEALMTLDLSERERQRVVAATTAVISYLTAARCTTLADFTGERDARIARESVAGHPDRWGVHGGPCGVGAEVAPVLAVADATATAIVARACYSSAHLPVAMDALSAGEMTEGHLNSLIQVARLATTGDQLVGLLEAEAIRLAPGRTATQLHADLMAFAAAHDPEHHGEAVRAGIAERDVWTGRSSKAGCSRVSADLPAEHAQAMLMWINAIARAAKAAGDVRGIGQLRADLLVAATTGVLADMLTTALATTTSDTPEDGQDGNGNGRGGLKVPVPTPEDIARLFELNILITDTGNEPDSEHDDPDDPDGPGPGGPGDGGPRGGGDGDEPDPGGELDHGDGVEPEGADPDSDATVDGAAPADPNRATARPRDRATARGRAARDRAARERAARERAEHVAAIHAALQALARWTGPQPLNQPDAHLAPVPIIISHSTLLGADDQPGHLPGYGPISADRVRDLAQAARFRWLHADPATGYLIHRHPRTHPPPPAHGWHTASPPTPPPLPDQVSAAMAAPGYTPGALLRAHIHTRDATCIGRTHHHPARGVDLDHVINYGETRDGVLGQTAGWNLAAECRSLHLRKTHGRWSLEQPTPGHFIWTSPLGDTHHRTATPLIPYWNHAA